jgi:hypothetical protein
MIDWITRSRLRTALVIAFFFGIFVFSIHSFFLSSASRAPSGGSASTPAYREAIRRPGVPQKPSQPAPAEQSNALNLLSAAVGMFGTLSTVWFAWRADQRAKFESNAKVMQMQQEIAELRRNQQPPGNPGRSM